MIALAALSLAVCAGRSFAAGAVLDGWLFLGGAAFSVATWLDL